MTEQKPLVSVVIPVYNGGRYIAETLDSVLEQSYPSIEIIVVDDGSTDNTISVVQQKSAVARILQQKNKGVSVARNVGMSNAKGEYILFLDADDLIGPTMIETLATYLIENPDYSVASGNARLFFDRNGEKDIVGVTGYEGDAFASVSVFCFQSPGAALVRRDMAIEIGGFDPIFGSACEDWLFFLKAAYLYKWKMLQISEFYYRMHEGGASMKYDRVHSLTIGIPEIFHNSYPKAPYSAKARRKARYLINVDTVRRMGRTIRAAKENRGSEISRALRYTLSHPVLIGSWGGLVVAKVRRTLKRNKG